MELRDYQVECCDAVDKAFAGGQEYCLVELPTASGKTVTFVETIRRRGGRALVLAHREELLNQATDKLVAAGIHPWQIGRVMAGRNEHDHEIVVASVQTLARSARRAPLMRQHWDTIVVDEAHHSPAESYQNILRDLVGHEHGTLVLGVTATINRKGMGDIWGEPVYSKSILEMIDAGWLSELKAKRIALDMSFKGVRKAAGDYRADDLAGALLKAEAPRIVVKRWMEEADNRHTLVFTPTVPVAHAVAEAFGEQGIDAEAIDGTTAATDRAGAIERFRSGETMVLCNCALFTEGVDLPMCSCVVIARPTLSPLLYAQMLGRGLRLHPGKDDCLILDLAGASKRHTLGKLKQADGPVTVSDIVGVPVGPDGINRQSLEREQQVQNLVAQIRYVGMVDVDLFGGDGQGRRFLQLDQNTVLLPCAQGRCIAVSGTTLWLFGKGGEQTVVTNASSPEGALRKAQSLAEGYGKGPRGRGPATAAQVNYLCSLRPELSHTVVSRLASGQVSDLIDLHRTARKLERWRMMRGARPSTVESLVGRAFQATPMGLDRR